jgi:hypothetical protein
VLCGEKHSRRDAPACVLETFLHASMSDAGVDALLDVLNGSGLTRAAGAILLVPRFVGIRVLRDWREINMILFLSLRIIAV